MLRNKVSLTPNLLKAEGGFELGSGDAPVAVTLESLVTPMSLDRSVPMIDVLVFTTAEVELLPEPTGVIDADDDADPAGTTSCPWLDVAMKLKLVSDVVCDTVLRVSDTGQAEAAMVPLDNE